MFVYIAFSAFGILLALFLAVFKKKSQYRLVSAIIAAAITVANGEMIARIAASSKAKIFNTFIYIIPFFGNLQRFSVRTLR